MHECPNCGQACDCLGDDTWNVDEAAYCQCECEEDYEDGWGDDDDEDEYDASDWRELGGEG